MDICNTREMKSFAEQRLASARDEKRIVTIYAGLTLGLSALATLASFLMDLQISRSGGLGSMGMRTVLSSLQSMLPIVTSLVGLCLNVGYQAAMLRVARGQYASPQSLRLGFDRFWVLLRTMVLQGLIYCGIAIAGIYLAVMIYMFTPLSNSAMEIVSPLLSDMTILNSGIMLDDTTYAQLVTAMVPAFLIFGLIFCAAAIPVMYRFRMANYVIIDHPGQGALAALRQSRKMMKGNCLRMFRLDLSLWWYYAAMVGVSLICYGDVLLPMLGVRFPWNEGVSYFLFFILYLAVQFAVYFYLRNRVEVVYALAYDAVKPEEKQGGVVLGNIFQM